MRVIITVIFLLVAGFSFGTDFSVAATTQGTWADLLTGTRKLRSEGVVFTEDTRKITEKFQFLVEEKAEWKSLRTFAGRDIFRFTKTDIFFERDGLVYAVYHIATGTVSFEAAAEAFSYDNGSTLSPEKAGQFPVAPMTAGFEQKELEPVSLSSKDTDNQTSTIGVPQAFTDTVTSSPSDLVKVLQNLDSHTASEKIFSTPSDIQNLLSPIFTKDNIENQSALRPLKRAVQKGQLSLYEMKVFQDRLEIEKIKNAKTTLVFSFSDSSVIERPYQASTAPKENTIQLNMRSWEEEIFKEQLAAICGKHTVQKLKTGEILEFQSGKEKITVLALRNEILIGIDSPTGSRDYEIPAKDITKRKYRKVLEKLSASIKEKEPATARLFSFGILFS